MNYGQIEMPGTEVPCIAAIDCGDAIVITAPDGSTIVHKAPETPEGYMDLAKYEEILSRASFILIERQLPRQNEGARMTENDVYPCYRELYGFLKGLKLNVEPILPKAWQKALGFPSASTLIPSRPMSRESLDAERLTEGEEYLIDGKWLRLDPKNPKDKKLLQAKRYSIWKNFLHSEAISRFPQVKKLHKYSADALLIYKVATMMAAKEPQLAGLTP